MFKYILAIIDLLLGLPNDKYAWEASLPIGSESIRLLDLIKRLSTSLFDFQRLNIYNYKDEDDEIDITQTIFSNFKNSSNFNRNKLFNLLPHYVLFDIKFEHIGNLFLLL